MWHKEAATVGTQGCNLTYLKVRVAALEVELLATQRTACTLREQAAAEAAAAVELYGSSARAHVAAELSRARAESRDEARAESLTEARAEARDEVQAERRRAEAAEQAKEMLEAKLDVVQVAAAQAQAEVAAARAEVAVVQQKLATAQQAVAAVGRQKPGHSLGQHSLATYEAKLSAARREVAAAHELTAAALQAREARVTMPQTSP